MRVALKVDGGFSYFPSIKKPLVVNTNLLDNEDVKVLVELVDEADFFDLPPLIGETPPSTGADHQKYTLTISEEERNHSVAFYAGMLPDESPLHDDIYALVDFLREKGIRE